MRPVVYVGLSVTEEEAGKVLDADYRPPIKRGDLADLSSGTRIVGIIDGVILSDAAVGHREILDLMRSGVTVIGGGSMGALRAAELQDFGMIGVGRVFEEYASGRVEGDDEVVLAFDPFTHRSLSEPLINLRLNLQKAVAAEALDPDAAMDILGELKALFYPKRSYAAMFDIARERLEEGAFERLLTFGKSGFEDFKKNDAFSVLTMVKKKHQK